MKFSKASKLGMVGIFVVSMLVACGKKDENANLQNGGCFWDAFGQQICPGSGQVPSGGIPGGSQTLIDAVNALGTWEGELWLNGTLYDRNATITAGYSLSIGPFVTIAGFGLDDPQVTFQAGFESFGNQLTGLLGEVWFSFWPKEAGTQENTIILDRVIILGGSIVRVDFIETGILRTQDSSMENLVKL